ncbi:MAG: GNAT family N-acetyltransferase [Gemmatimonadota bacterium]
MAEIRHLESLADYDECVELQRATWGDDFSDVVPASILKVSQKVGGLLVGAYADDRMVGFVYSLLGYQGGSLVQWSHMLAVHADARGRGLGRLLKLYQRSELLKRSVKTVFWTFDPLVAQNAHLNINRLGASIAGYVPNMYGENTGSPLHAGGDTDRFIVRWDLDSARVKWAVDGDVVADRSGAATEANVVTLPDIGETIEDLELPETNSVLIEVPCDSTSLGEQDPETLTMWRHVVRKAFLNYLGRHYAVQSFHHDAATSRCYYFLRRP